MASVRSLRELLADLVGDAGARSGGPKAYLAEHGHPDLPAELVAEAVVSFADTAPPEVAEQLAPFVTAHTSGQGDGAGWFDLLTSALAGLPEDPDTLDGAPAPRTGDDAGLDAGPSLDFGAGAADAIDLTAALDEEPAVDAAPTGWPDADEQVLPDPADSAVAAVADQDVVADDEPDDEPNDEPNEDSVD
ncbi:hypothetical protein [Saccharothrix sp. ALI-22-I]|uniref:hypothetical protein n=1 Tax=Saccharothrix sp. ALI-22-I TaxID=1933778 RepID=UPI00117B7970|nr:hypothetical protein [Saccharothrix sp. ALI-22-I]